MRMWIGWRGMLSVTRPPRSSLPSGTWTESASDLCRRPITFTRAVLAATLTFTSSTLEFMWRIRISTVALHLVPHSTGKLVRMMTTDTAHMSQVLPHYNVEFVSRLQELLRVPPMELLNWQIWLLCAHWTTLATAAGATSLPPSNGLIRMH